MGGHADEGSASVWTLGVAFLLVSTVYAVLLVCAAVGARHRAEAAADLSALAGATAAQTGGNGCAAARRVAAGNLAQLRSCVVAVDLSVTVDVQVMLPPALSRWASGPVRATARAGS